VSDNYDKARLPRRCVARLQFEAGVLSLGIRAGCYNTYTQPAIELDRINIISIDTNLDVRPDSMAVLKAAQEVVEEDGFQEVLDSVRGRVDEIESLHRTRELTVCTVRCDLWYGRLNALCSSRT
jgi:hypothetical protein